MADPEHLEILKQGVEMWNTWRRTRPQIKPDLSYAELDKANLASIDLNGANLQRTQFDQADLRGAKLTSVTGRRTSLRNARLTHADLRWCGLLMADLSGAKLSYANCSYADFHGASFRGANLIGANLACAELYRVDFTRALLEGADIEQAQIGGNDFGENDLSNVKGLDTVRHSGSSVIGVKTFYLSHGNIPEVFLRGCGLPESFIVQIPALVAALQPIQFYSCFISYSSKDQEFADRLYADLQNKGVRCWFAPEDLKIGDRFRDRIDESIRLHDKLLLILSENSVASQWVGDEVEAAFEREQREGRTVLFPIRIDDAVLDSDKAWAAAVRRTRHVGNFTRWKEHDSYTKALDRLLRDLKAGA